MKKLLSVLLIIVLVVASVSCGEELTPAQEAANYITKLNEEKDKYASTYWTGSFKTYNGELCFEVHANLSYYSNVGIETFENALLSSFNTKAYPGLKEIFEKDENIDHIYILFYYGNGNISRFVSYDGKIIDISNLDL